MSGELKGLSAVGFTTLSQQVTNELRNSIIENRLKAGTRITESELSKTLGVSRTVIREAIAELSKNGFLEKESSHCTRVASYSDKDISEIYDMRTCLELGALRLMDDPKAIVDELRAIDEKAKTIAFSEPFDGLMFVMSDMDFHTCIISGSGNSLLMDAWQHIIGPLEVLLHRYIFYIVNNSVEKRASYDHARIIEAFSSMDKDSIGAVLTEHSMVMKQILLDKLSESEEKEASGQ